MFWLHAVMRCSISKRLHHELDELSQEKMLTLDLKKSGIFVLY